MTININELRQLAQTATPGPWINHGRVPNAPGVPHSAVAAKTLLARVYSEAWADFRQETANANLIAAANPAAIIELLDRLEAAEKETASWKGLAKQFGNEADALRAKIAEMGKQEPVGEVVIMDYGYTAGRIYTGKRLSVGAPLYASPGAQQCRNCNGMGDRFNPSGEKIPCDLCESNLEEIRALVAEAAHDIISGSDFWLSTSLAAKKIYALPGAKGEEK